MLSTAAGSQPLPAGLSVGLGLFTGQRPPGAVHSPYSGVVALARAAEQAGFDAFWVSEHHFLPDGYLPAPLVLLSALASATERIALGSGLALAPLYHPLRLAEDAAVVDLLSAGRLVLGLGLGYAAEEYRVFGVRPADRGRRLSDLVPLLRRAWLAEPFGWRGAALSVERVCVTPTPARPGGPPVWLGGYADAAVRRAGRLADGYLLGRADPAVLAAVLPVLAAVRRPDDPSFTVALNATVLLTDDPRDARSARSGLAYQQATYQRIQHGRDTYAGRVPEPDGTVGPEQVDRYAHAVGDPDEVAGQLADLLRPLRGWARVHLVLRALFSEPDHTVQLDRIDRLGATVLPALRRMLPDLDRP